MAAGADIVATASEAAGAERPPLARPRAPARRSSTSTASARGRSGRSGSATGAARTSRSCSSAATTRFVLRRPPRPPLPPSAHDMVREARLQLALAPHGIRLPPIVADLRGRERDRRAVLRDATSSTAHVVTSDLPPGLEEPAARRRLGEELVDALVEIHAADVTRPCARRVRPPRQLPRATGAPLHAAVGDQRDARDPGRRRGRRAGSPTSCPSRFPTRSSTATTGSAT